MEAPMPRNEKEVDGAQYHVETRAENIVDLADIVSRTRHQIADGLERVEGHALAKQTDIKLVSNIPFNSLGGNFKTKIAEELCEPADDLRNANNRAGAKEN